MTELFEQCEICGSNDWEHVYEGKVREGSHGRSSSGDAVVAECARCGVQRLNEQACAEEELYESEAYRRLLNEPEDAAGFFREHDVLQLRNLTVLWPDSLRSRVVADIGCGAGSFLDHVCGLSGEAIAVEPCRAYHESLRERGYRVYGLTPEAAADWSGRVDYAFCFSVIEHVPNPLAFLREVRALMAPGGRLVVSTPNREDVLMALGGDVYRRFFYRTVHRWYFDQRAFADCARRAGLHVEESVCVHRFGLSNAMAWLRDGRPTGDARLPHLDSDLLDDFWKRYLEGRGVGDYLYFKLIAR